MKKYIISLFLILCLSITVYAKVPVVFKRAPVDINDPSAAALATTAKKITSDKTTGEPGFMGVYDSNDTNIYGVKGPNNITTNILEIPPDTLPTNGQTKVYGTPVVRSASGNIPAHTELPFIWSTITGGGSSLIPEVLTAPNHSDLTTGQAVICRQTGSLYIKTDRGLYNTTSLNFTPIPPILTITSPSEGAWVNPNNTEIVGTTTCPTGVENVTVAGFASGTATTSDSFVNWSSGITTNGIDGYKTFTITATGILSPHLTDVEELHLNCDATDPVLGTITPSVSTHNGTGTSVNITVASVTETNESNRQYSIYNVTTSAIVGSWNTFTGLTINNIILPSNQNTYRVDVRCVDLAGNIGTASSANITYSTPLSELNDTFTDTNSTALASHTSDSSHTWTQNGGGTIIVYTNHAESSQSTSAGLYYSSFVPTDADYTVTLDITSTGSGCPIFVAGRCSISAVTMYGCRWNGTDTWELTRWVSGTRTVIGTYVGDSPVGTSRTVALSMTGSTIAISIGGVSRISVTDTGITAAGRPGIGTWYNDVPTYHNIFIDNIEVTD